jgi:hypothetical protein
MQDGCWARKGSFFGELLIRSQLTCHTGVYGIDACEADINHHRIHLTPTANSWINLVERWFVVRTKTGDEILASIALSSWDL